MTAHSKPRHATPHKVVSESVRERETFRYWLPFQISQVVQDFRQSPQPTERLSSVSTILTALTQLGIYHLGAERAFVSLFDSEYQYFIAEATSGTYLRPSVPNHQHNEPFRLCGTAARRGHDACDYTILNNSDDDSKHEDDGVLPVTVVPNLVDDTRFPAYAIPMLGPSHATSYAAVPIRTRRGINIGLYHVVNTTEREWTHVNSDRLRDISCAISDHLETESLKAINRRNARMNRGIGSFIEGGSTLTGWRHESNLNAFEDVLDSIEGNLNSRQQTLESDLESVTSDGPPFEDDELSNQARHASAPTTPAQRTKDTVWENQSQVNVFSRAANIIRESVEVEGCLFLDATTASYRASKANTAGGRSGFAGHSSSTSSDDSPHSREDGKADRTCDIKGYSTSKSSSIDRVPGPASSVALSEKFIKKMLNQYPNGKVFVFNADGELQTSDSSSDEVFSLSPSADRDRPVGQKTRSSSSSPHTKLQRKPLSRQREGRIISAAFPGARSVAFFPVWDPTKERWSAGGLIYTNTPMRTFTVQGELSYLRGFGTLAAVEISRLEALQSEKIKSDALGSLSHELRSPLHGVLLSTELIADTKLDVFQTNIAHTIETCSRTLLDTIDHLLDYSRVNNLANSNKKVTTNQPTSHFNKPGSQHFGKVLVTDYSLDELVEDVVESVFAGFNFQHKSINQYVSRHQQQPQARSTPRHADNTANTASDYLEAMDQLNPGVNESTGTTFSFENLTVILSLESGCDWLFRFHVGAVRRIVMNIVGNALKYTTDGTITISLTQQVATVRRRRPEQVVCFVVKDTGKGISQEYLQRGVFKPFTQEDDLSPGTGIGLSLVRQIVKQFRGQISIESQVGVGTTVTVLLPLERPRSSGVPSLPLKAQAKFHEQVQDLAGLRVRIAPGSTHNSILRNTLGHICKEWLKLELLAEDDNSRKPDLMLWIQQPLPITAQHTDSFSLIPNVVICQDALAAYEKTRNSSAAGWKGVFEFVSQPVGPRKLAKTLSLAYSRWAEDDEPRPTTPPPGSSIPAINQRPTPGRSSSYSFPLLPNLDDTSRLKPNLPPYAAVASEGAGNAAVRAPAKLQQIEQEPCDPDDHAPRMLLVEDNHINMKLLVAYMKKLQIRYDKAFNGQEAVEKYTQSPRDFACILSDISMPVMNGFEAVRLIRAFENKEGIEKGVPIFAISGLATEEAQIEAHGSGFDLFLAKPVKLQELGELLREKDILEYVKE